MKFLLVSPFTNTSGSAIRFWNIAEQLRRHGHKIVYIERVADYSFSPTFTGVTYLTSRKLKLLHFDILYSLLFNLVSLLRHHDCDVYYCLKPAPNSGIPGIVAKLLGRKVILDIDDLDYGYLKPGFNRKISSFFFHFLPKHFDLVTVHTDALYAFALERLHVPEKKLYYLAQGVSEAFLEEKYLPTLPPRKSIVYVATLGITSELDCLIPVFRAAVNAHPDLVIKIVGDGVRRPRFETAFEELGMKENVTFFGRVDHDELPAIMADSWVGVNYMRSNLTNDCRAILKLREYLALGLHIVCNSSGDAELFRDFVCIENDPQSMGEAICRILDAGWSLNTEGREFIFREFQWSNIIDRFLPELCQAVGQSSKAPN